MPYTPEHKARTRARIVASARVMFNRHGFEQVSIDQIMRHAGLTRGGFYNHFKSKQALYAEAVQSFASDSPFTRRLAAITEENACAPPPRDAARLLVEMYLSDDALAAVDRQCPLIAVSSDVARAGAKPRAAYTRVLESMVAVFRAGCAPRAEADQRALLIANLCIGGMVLARTTQDERLRRELRAVARKQALALLEA